MKSEDGMSNYSFKIEKSYTALPEFAEASKEELRVLLTLIEKDGRISLGELAASASVGEARCRACIALWESLGVLTLRDSDTPEVTDEHEERLYPGELYEVSNKEIAHSIRDKGLADLFYDIAKTAGKHELTPMEVNRITRLITQYELSAEYVATLCAYLAEEENFSVERLIRRAMKLANDGVDTVRLLEEYIAARVRENGELSEIHRILGIYRKLSSTEQKYINRWLYDYGFSSAIIGLAYELSVTGKQDVPFPYMEKLLSDWHESGCKTIEECEARSNETKSRLQAEWQSKKTKPAAPKKKTPRYGDFDPEEALRRALNRSFAPSVVPESEEK
jgi:DnaD/phage-associated family protein